MGWTFAGCSSGEENSGQAASGKMSGAMDKGKMDGGAMDKGKMDGGAMDKGKMDGGAMDKGKMDGGAMDKGKMAVPWIKARWINNRPSTTPDDRWPAPAGDRRSTRRKAQHHATPREKAFAGDAPFSLGQRADPGRDDLERNIDLLGQ